MDVMVGLRSSVFGPRLDCQQAFGQAQSSGIFKLCMTGTTGLGSLYVKMRY
jgi:hypothetical protein